MSFRPVMRSEREEGPEISEGEYTRSLPTQPVRLQISKHMAVDAPLLTPSLIANCESHLPPSLAPYEVPYAADASFIFHLLQNWQK